VGNFPSDWFFLDNPPDVMAFIDNETGEIITLNLCPKCKTYVDTEHYCGSVALVQCCNGNHPESPRFYRWLLFCKDWGKY